MRLQPQNCRSLGLPVARHRRRASLLRLPKFLQLDENYYQIEIKYEKAALPDTGGKIACWLQLIGGETSSLSLFKNCFLFLFSSKYHQNNVFKSFNKFTFTCLRQQKASYTSLHLSSLTDTDGLKNKSHWKPCTGNLFAITFITVFVNSFFHIFTLALCI